MPLPFSWPSWLPAWATIALLAVLLLYLLIFLLMPFSVFGLKPRLDRMELLLDDLQAEIRALALRLPESDGLPTQPPIAPANMPQAPRAAAPAPEEERPRRAGPSSPARTEPRLNWPR